MGGCRGAVDGRILLEVRPFAGLEAGLGGNVIGDPDGMAQARRPADAEGAAVEDRDVIGSGIGPETREPVRFTVSTMRAALWSMMLDS